MWDLPALYFIITLVAATIAINVGFHYFYKIKIHNKQKFWLLFFRILTALIIIGEIFKTTFMTAVLHYHSPNMYVPLYVCSLMTYALFVYAWSPKESKVSTFSFATYCAASLIFLVVFLVSPETTFANFPEMAFGGLEITFYAWYSFIYHAIFFVIFFLIIINYSCPLKRVSVLYATAGIEGYLLFTYIISCILVWTMHFEPSAVDWNMLLSSSKFPPMEPLFATLGLWSGLIMSMLISLATGIIFALFYFSKNKINHLLLAPPIEKNTINTINLLFFFKHNI